MSDQENLLNANQPTVSFPDHDGLVRITAANYTHSSYTFVASGVKIIELTTEMGEGKITVTDDHIKQLWLRNSDVLLAAGTIFSNVEGVEQKEIVRKALSTFFVGLLNEFHKDLNERAKSNGR